MKKVCRLSNGCDGLTDRDYMKRAILLAQNGMGWTAPNPMVGAVIVKDGRIIGEGWHRRCGDLHAERNAIASLTESAEGATIYVTLEPCCHHGKTPPCTDAIIENRIARVVIGSGDPNPKVSGKGAAILREHGIEVVEGVLAEECDSINPEFFHYITTGLPYTAVKFAMTLDGKIASRTGASKWITGETARKHVHSLRGRYAAILAGIGTVMADNPMLNCRIEGAHQPLRVIVDSHLRISDDSRIIQSARDYPTLIACAGADPEKRKRLESFGAEVISLPAADGRVALPILMEELGRREISSVLAEGGGEIHESLISTGCADHVYAYIAPLIMGGKDARTPVEGIGADSPDSAAHLINRKITLLEEDILLEYDYRRG